MVAATLEGADFGVDDAAEAFIRRMSKEDGKSPSESESEEQTPEDDTEEEDDTHEEGSEATEEETDEDGEPGDDESEPDEDDGEQTESKDKPKKKVILENDADAYVKHKIDGKDVEIKVSDLTRLYGQEAALTRKSTEAAELRKAAEAQATKYVAGLEQMVQRAQTRFEPYSKIDWIAITKDPNFSKEDAQALYAEAQKAHDDLQFLQTSLDAVVKDVHQQRHNELVKKGQEAWKVLSDEKTGIKGWGEKLYGEVTKFATDNGISTEVIKNLVDPSAIKLLHKAMLYDKSQTAVAKTSKVNKTPKKIIKESSEAATSKVKAGKVSDAEKRLRLSGSLDDATDAFMARMKL